MSHRLVQRTIRRTGSTGSICFPGYIPTKGRRPLSVGMDTYQAASILADRALSTVGRSDYVGARSFFV